MNTNNSDHNSIQDMAKRLQSIIDTAIDGIITIDAKGIVENINPAAATLFGYESGEITNRNIKMLMPDPYRSEHDGYMSRYIKTKVPHIIGIGREVLGKRKDGSEFPFRLAVSEVILNDRVIFTGIIHDLSDVKRAQEEVVKLNEDLEQIVVQRTYELEDAVNQLLKTNDLLEYEVQERKEISKKLEEQKIELHIALEKEKELNELKSRFVSMASHEFRTPLSTILSSAALISRYENSDQQSKRERHIKKIKSAVANLTGILNDFLSLDKLEEGKIELKPERIIFSEICKDVIEQVEGLLKKGQEIVHHHTGEEKMITSDKNIIKNILFNLISNAIKYSGEGDKIYCNVRSEADKLLIEIKDEGIGIPDEDQKYLFERFFRASNVTNIQGTGLGLNIVKKYVEMLNGNIAFQSKYGVGSSFKITIPIEQA